MPKHRQSFKVGEPVWAHIEGYPWWPARVVTRSEVMVDPATIPQLQANQLLVEFFNDKHRWSAVETKCLRGFTNPRYRHINKNNRDFLDELAQAEVSATEYAIDYGWDTSGGDTAEKRAQLDRLKKSRKKQKTEEAPKLDGPSAAVGRSESAPPIVPRIAGIEATQRGLVNVPTSVEGLSASGDTRKGISVGENKSVEGQKAPVALNNFSSAERKGKPFEERLKALSNMKRANEEVTMGASVGSTELRGQKLPLVRENTSVRIIEAISALRRDHLKKHHAAITEIIRKRCVPSHDGLEHPTRKDVRHQVSFQENKPGARASDSRLLHGHKPVAGKSNGSSEQRSNVLDDRTGDDARTVILPKRKEPIKDKITSAPAGPALACEQIFSPPRQTRTISESSKGKARNISGDALPNKKRRVPRKEGPGFLEESEAHPEAPVRAENQGPSFTRTREGRASENPQHEFRTRGHEKSPDHRPVGDAHEKNENGIAAAELFFAKDAYSALSKAQIVAVVLKRDKEIRLRDEELTLYRRQLARYHLRLMQYEHREKQSK